MDDSLAAARPNLVGRLVLVVPILLAALAYQGYHAWIAFDSDDTNHLETPLAMAAARQLADGPSTLYGPFSGSDPLVLIHAPLYYRLVGLAAWPIAKTGVSPVASSLIAGRALSCVGLALTLLAAWTITRMGGIGPFGGLVTIGLIASSAIFGSFGFTVRPDTLGLALQTSGFALTLAALTDGRQTRGGRILLAGIAFGLAACVRQNLLVAAGISAAMLLIASARGRVSRAATTSGLALGAIVPIAYYGWEQWVTAGHLAEAVFVLPSRLRETAGGSWNQVKTVFFEVGKRGVGEIALGLTLLMIGGRRTIVGTRIDAALWVVLLAETAIMIPLCLASEGSWVNYAMPPVVWASVLIGRVADRLANGPPLGWRILPLTAAGMILVVADARLIDKAESVRRDDRELMAQVLADPLVASVPPDCRYFVSVPQHNRRFGRVSLAHDEWLYASFEEAGLAEPRAVWLSEAITGVTASGGPSPEALEVVIVPTPDDDEPGARPRAGGYVPGVGPSLPDLGFGLVQQYEHYAVWSRNPARR